jgi:hydrogenase 3 maturation protease
MSEDWESRLEEWLVRPGRLAILGVGNLDKADDAAGSLCVALVRTNFHGVRPDLLVVQGGTSPENETGRVRAFGPTEVLIVDAALGGHPAGTIFVVDPQDISHDDLSTHHMPLSLLIRYLEASLECRVLCVGVEPRSVDPGDPVSDPVKRSVAYLAEKIVDLLTRRPL